MGEKLVVRDKNQAVVGRIPTLRYKRSLVGNNHVHMTPLSCNLLVQWPGLWAWMSHPRKRRVNGCRPIRCGN